MHIHVIFVGEKELNISVKFKNNLFIILILESNLYCGVQTVGGERQVRRVGAAPGG